MKIEVCSVSAEGPSEKTALDSALRDIGMNRYNMVEFSSVIPASASIEINDTVTKSYPAGSAVSVVLSTDYSEPSDEESAYAELCWNKSSVGSGYFLESDNGERITDSEVEHMESNREQDFPDQCNRITAISDNTDNYNCALVIAVYGRINTEYRESPY